MKAEILDKINELNSICYLTKIVLKDFVSSLPQNYRDYEVQREIVNNTYLDNLIVTVLEKKHIPPIVLVVDDCDFINTGDSLKINNFEILDGLQRTYRLKLIWDSILFFKAELSISSEILNQTRLGLSRKYAVKLGDINSNSKILESIIKFYNKKTASEGLLFDMETCYENYQWFEVWTGLIPEEEVNKMLILNAGHKSVRNQHQLELLFLNIIPILKKSSLPDFKLVREKEANSRIFSKNRSYGEFHFSHLITSILSLNAGQPLTPNVDLVHKTQSSDFEIEQLSKYFNYDFLHTLINTLLKLDKALENEYHELGIKWLGREVSLIGLFAALGKLGIERNVPALELLDILEAKIISKPTVLNLREFEEARNSVDLSKVNIGTVNKKAVFKGLYSVLAENNGLIDWRLNFKLVTA